MGGNVGDDNDTNIHNVLPVIDLDGRVSSSLKKTDIEEIGNACNGFLMTLRPELPKRLESAVDYLFKSSIQETTTLLKKGFNTILSELPSLEMEADDDTDLLEAILYSCVFLHIVPFIVNTISPPRSWRQLCWANILSRYFQVSSEKDLGHQSLISGIWCKIVFFCWPQEGILGLQQVFKSFLRYRMNLKRSADIITDLLEKAKQVKLSGIITPAKRKRDEGQ